MHWSFFRFLLLIQKHTFIIWLFVVVFSPLLFLSLLLFHLFPFVSVEDLKPFSPVCSFMVFHSKWKTPREIVAFHIAKLQAQGKIWHSRGGSQRREGRNVPLHMSED